jgi:hypothetical protein
MSVAEFSPEAAPFVSDYVPGAVGHGVLAVGRDHAGADAVAVWQVSPTGQPTGAWIVATGPGADPAKAQRLLGVLTRCALIGWRGGDTAEALRRLAAVADTEPDPALEKTGVYLPDALAEIADYRRRHADAVDTYQQTSKSKVAPLVWHRDVPTGANSPAELAELAGLAVGSTPGTSSEVAERALRMARLVAWTASLWQETEQVRLRRRYLVERFGPASPLPPRWLAQLRAASARTGAKPVMAQAG